MGTNTQILLLSIFLKKGRNLVKEKRDQMANLLKIEGNGNT